MPASFKRLKSLASCAALSLALAACSYSDDELLSESQGQITVSSTGVVQQTAAAPVAEENAPLVIIRFDRPEIAYGDPLAQIVRRTRARRPDARFDVVAVSPSIGLDEDVVAMARSGRERGEQVFATLAEIGVPPEDISLAATVSAAVTVNEVHIYLR